MIAPLPVEWWPAAGLVHDALTNGAEPGQGPAGGVGPVRLMDIWVPVGRDRRSHQGGRRDPRRAVEVEISLATT